MPSTPEQRALILGGGLTLTTSERDAMREGFRCAVLREMDSATRSLAIEAFGGMDPSKYGMAGARDADLPELFKALDAQFDRNLAFLDVEIDDRSEAELMDAAEQRFASQ